MRSFAFLLACLLGLAACSPASDTSSGGATDVATGGGNAWTQHGVLRFATNADPKNLNPLLASATPTLDLAMFMYSWTVRYNDKSEPVPDAITEIPTVANGDVSKDGLTIKYKLRKDMKWHDGEPVTCKDMRFTWQAVMNPHNNVVSTDGFSSIKDVDCTDPYVAVVRMKQIYAPFLDTLWSVNGNAPILPEHLLGKLNDDKGSFNTAPYNSAPVGSGPFKFVEWQRGSGVRMEANPDFYLGKPKLREVDFKIMPDENTEVTQLRTHELDMVIHGTAAGWRQYQQIAGVTAIAPPVFTYDHLDFNLKRPIFQDLRVREALAYAIDRKAIREKVMLGLSDAAETDQSPRLSKAYTPDTAHHDYDPAKAKALLDRAGWIVGSDGIRVKNGQRLAFTIATQTESNNAVKTQAQVQRYWHDVGVDAQVKNAPTSTFFDNSANGILQGGKYDTALFAWVAAADPDDAPIYSARNFAPHGQNALFWDDPQAEKAFSQELGTVDPAKRQAAFKIIQQRLAADVPTIVIGFRREPLAYNSDLKNFASSPVISPFWNPWEYSI
jgi:peptide/nickel transport system substrate-binding protein